MASSTTEPWMDSRQSRIQLDSDVIVRRESAEGGVQWYRYDLSEDAGEASPLPLSPDHTALQEGLRALAREPLESGLELDLDTQMRARLHALGYVDR